MNAVSNEVIARFVERSARVSGAMGMIEQINVLENPHEEILDGYTRGRPVKMFAKGIRPRVVARPSGGQARLEENYLYSSRRFPTGTNNTIGSGALAVSTNPFFGKAVGDDGVGVGFPTGFVLGLPETNMEVAGQIPQGSSFVFNQLGVAFNADAKVGDVNTLMEACTLQFNKSGGTFTLNHGQVKYWPGGVGNGGFAAAATTVAATTMDTQVGINGTPDIRAVRNLRVARTLRAQDVFSYNMLIARTTKATDGTAWALSTFVVATIWLWGAQKNAIQP